MGALIADVVAWFADPSNVAGSRGFPVRIGEHLRYSATALLIAALIAVPIGAIVGHTGRGGVAVVGIANGLRSLPEIGVVLLLVVFLGGGVDLTPVIIALVVLAVPPLLGGTYAGIRNVDRATVDAARGMGMTEREILTKVELPNALPLIIGGLRTATLQVIATAAVAALVGVGGLGRYLIDGLGVRDYTQMAAGALLIAAVALAAEAVLAGVQRLVVSPGLRLTASTGRRAAAPPSEPTRLPASRTPEPELARS